MSQPLVSILIPCYNAAPWLAQTLDSALAQTWANKEIIVVDDGSRDESLSVARGYEARGVRVVAQANAGQSAAFNTALRSARGEYYEFLDADDLLAPDKLEIQMERLSRLPEGWLATGRWARFNANPEKAEFSDGPVAADLPPVEWVVTLWNAGSMMHGAAWLIPASAVRRCGGWNDELSLINDFEFFSRLVLASAGVAYCPGARSYYRSGLGTSLSGSKTPAAWRSAFESIRLGTDRLIGRENSERTRAACASVWRSVAFASSVDAPDLSRRAVASVERLGFALGRPAGGPWFRLLSGLVGWRLARRLQHARKRVAAS